MTTRRWFSSSLASLLVLVGIVLAPGGGASAAQEFTFFGSGYGHGLGLSQWGAYGLAQEGWSYRRILTHFYSDTRVERAAHTPGSLRVGLLQGRSSVHVEARGGPVALRTKDHRRGTLVGRVPKGERWTIRSAGDRFKVVDDRGRVVGHRGWGGAGTNLYATYGDHAFVPETGNDYNRGYLEMNLTDCGRECSLRIILDAPLEQYLYGVAEVSSSWPGDALRAQVVAARSYAVAKVERYGQHAGACNCGLSAGWDQAYAGWDKEHGTSGDRWVAAVRDTKRQVVTYHGEAIQAFYSASSGGWTEDNENVWGGTPIPYLRGVCDPGDYTRDNPSRTWRLVRTAAEVTSALRSATGDIGTVERFTSVQRGVSGRIVTLRAQGSSGGKVISGSQLRAGLGLRDDRVWIGDDLNVEGAIRKLYDKLECAPGLPVAARTSSAGGEEQRFEAGTIIRNDRDSLTVWVRGALLEEYLAHGGAAGELGFPTSRMEGLDAAEGCDAGPCTRLMLEHGVVYDTPAVGAHALTGAVLAAYLGSGGPAGTLGFPTTSVQAAIDGSTSASFEHGSITCDAGGNCAAA